MAKMMDYDALLTPELIEFLYGFATAMYGNGYDTIGEVVKTAADRLALIDGCSAEDYELYVKLLTWIRDHASDWEQALAEMNLTEPERVEIETTLYLRNFFESEEDNNDT